MSRYSAQNVALTTLGPTNCPTRSALSDIVLQMSSSPPHDSLTPHSTVIRLSPILRTTLTFSPPHFAQPPPHTGD